MTKWIVQDVKRTLKNRKTYLLLTVIILSIIISIAQAILNNNHAYATVDQTNYVMGMVDDDVDLLYQLPAMLDTHCLYNDEGYENVCLESIAIRETIDSMYSEVDTQTFYEMKLSFLNLATDNFYTYYEEANDELKARLALKSVDLGYLKAIKDDIKKLDYPEIHNIKLNDSALISLDKFNQYANALFEVNTAYQNNYPLNYQKQLTGDVFFANYLNDNFILLIMVSILLIFDSYYKDYQSGVIKTILSSPKKRFHYIIMKSSSTMISTLIIVFGPVLLAMIGLRIVSGFNMRAYPTYISRTTRSSLHPVRQYSHVISSEKSSTYYSTYENVCHYGPVSKYVVDQTSPTFGFQYNCKNLFAGSNMTMISLQHFNILTTYYFMLVLFFITLLNSLLSLMLSNQIYNLITMGLFIGLHYLFDAVFIGHSFLKLLPTTFLSPTQLLFELTPYTYYNGVLTLTISSIVILIWIYTRLEKKDFYY